MWRAAVKMKTDAAGRLLGAIALVLVHGRPAFGGRSPTRDESLREAVSRLDEHERGALL